MKRPAFTLLTLCLALLPALANAGTTRFDGFYIGAQVGGESYQVDVTYDLPNGGSRSDDASDSTFAAGVYMGRGRALGEIVYLGWEVDAMHHGMTGEFDDGREAMDMVWSMGAKLRLGSVVAERHLVYGLAGMRFARFDYKDETGYNVDNEDQKPVLPGLTLGGGYGFAMTDNIVARVEVAYTAYSAFRSAYLGGPLDGVEEKIRPRTMDYMVGLALHF